MWALLAATNANAGFSFQLQMPHLLLLLQLLQGDCSCGVVCIRTTDTEIAADTDCGMEIDTDTVHLQRQIDRWIHSSNHHQITHDQESIPNWLPASPGAHTMVPPIISLQNKATVHRP